jgi:hypothetical protein
MGSSIQHSNVPHTRPRNIKKKPATHARVRLLEYGPRMGNEAVTTNGNENSKKKKKRMGMRLCTLFSARTRSTYDPRIRHACTIKATLVRARSRVAAGLGTNRRVRTYIRVIYLTRVSWFVIWSDDSWHTWLIFSVTRQQLDLPQVTR